MGKRAYIYERGAGRVLSLSGFRPRGVFIRYCAIKMGWGLFLIDSYLSRSMDWMDGPYRGLLWTESAVKGRRGWMYFAVFKF